MKKFLIAFFGILIAALLSFGGFLFYQYQKTDESLIPSPVISLNGTEIKYEKCEWTQPVFGNILSRNFANAVDYTAPFTTTWAGPESLAIALVLPEDYSSSIQLISTDNETVYKADGTAWADLQLENGNYLFTATCTKTATDNEGYGSFSFSANLIVDIAPPPPEPMLSTGTLELQQGDILSLKLSNLPLNISPTADTLLGMSVFTPMADGEWRALIPVGNQCPVGDYMVDIAAGELSWQLKATVLAFDFDTQNLIIDETAPNITQANSPEAYQQYNNTIPPFWNTFDEETYWEGTFIKPVEGRITTEFGEIRYTNSNFSKGRPHWGMDIAAPTGTAVVAQNNGRVVFADYLLNTGNTLVIEYGGGLKSYYYHMSALHVVVDEMLEKGQLVGEVGTTGYSTGPHLHIEMRIGKNAISPSMMFLENGGIYSAELAEKANVSTASS